MEYHVLVNECMWHIYSNYFLISNHNVYIALNNNNTLLNEHDFYNRNGVCRGAQPCLGDKTLEAFHGAALLRIDTSGLRPYQKRGDIS